VETALPALQQGADAAGRPRPPLIAHVLVALTPDEEAALHAGREFLARYVRLPFYARMFAMAGHPIGGDGAVPDALVRDLVISGSASQVLERLRGALAAGLDELLVSLLPVGAPQSLERELTATVASTAP
jgi:alkanesulfonate monooxygenase SsuD/methylene tetrahydromethanopterin reductase-like flavin-dependent oxidoreductase (luciferase family)